jgi:broad specificity phosphatase PhoE
VLFSTHGGVKGALLMFLKNISFEDFKKRPRLENTSLSIVTFHTKKRHKIILENDIKHLK